MKPIVIVSNTAYSFSKKEKGLINARRSLAGSVIGGIRETQEMLDFCSKNKITSDIELIPIQKVNEAYTRVVNSDVRYRFVIDAKSFHL
jgi:uncharacterized zinc-type alcohol dehydrogenase-like protein